MKLRVVQELDNNKVRLDYVNTPGRPSRMPSYVVSRDLADEFVSKYNQKSETTSKTSFLSTLAGGLIGGGIALKNRAHKLSRPLLGAFTGFITSAIYIRNDRNKLMDTYNVKEYNS